MAFRTVFFEQDFSGGDRIFIRGQWVRLSPVFCRRFLKLRINRGWFRFFRLALRGAEKTPAREQQHADSR
jgi:hypothetical protein